MVMARRKPIEMKLDELLGLPVTVDLVTAGRAHGIGRTLSHELVLRDEFPCTVRKLGNRYRVTKADLLASLGLQLDGTPVGQESPEDQPGTAA